MADTWALLSDVHGNLPALHRALTDAMERGARRVAFLGDALGGPDDEECCRLLMNQTGRAVFGNREVRVRLRFPEDVQRWVRHLPATQVLDGALICHSSPSSAFPPDISAGDALAFRQGRSYWDLFPYVSGRASVLSAAEALANRGLTTAFHGHTHRQVVWRVGDGAPDRLRASEVNLGPEVTIVGLGSVGKGERGRVEYALFHPEEERVRLVSLAGE